jgi:hypothetical protein
MHTRWAWRQNNTNNKCVTTQDSQEVNWKGHAHRKGFFTPIECWYVTMWAQQCLVPAIFLEKLITEIWMENHYLFILAMNSKLYAGQVHDLKTNSPWIHQTVGIKNCWESNFSGWSYAQPTMAHLLYLFTLFLNWVDYSINLSPTGLKSNFK